MNDNKKSEQAQKKLVPETIEHIQSLIIANYKTQVALLQSIRESDEAIIQGYKTRIDYLENINTEIKEELAFEKRKSIVRENR